MNKSKAHILYSGATPEQVADDLTELVNFQSEGLSKAALQSLIDERLLPHLMLYDHPQFLSMFNAVLSEEARIGARYALAYNQGVTNWQVSPGGAVLEEMCCLSLCKLFRLEPSADATFMYSGTYGNLQALYMALHHYAENQGFDLAQEGVAGFGDPDRLGILVSKDAHFSLRHAVRTLGLGEKSLIALPVDHNRRIDIVSSRQVIKEIIKNRDIFSCVATAGTTTTGAIDPIDPLADICEGLGAWLHVDGAYGYAYKLIPEWTHRFLGDARADSIVWDPHKQFGAPIPSSVLFVKNKNEFSRMALHSSYFNRETDQEPNPGLKSPPSTRPMAALPLVTILRGKGVSSVIEDLRVPLEAVRKLAKTLDAHADVEVLHEPDSGILCFRMKPTGGSEDRLNELQTRIYEGVKASGERAISITKFDGITALRLVTVSPDISFEDLWEMIETLRGFVKLA